MNGTSPAKTLDLSEILDISEHGMSIQTSSPLETDHDLDTLVKQVQQMIMSELGIEKLSKRNK